MTHVNAFKSDVEDAYKEALAAVSALKGEMDELVAKLEEDAAAALPAEPAPAAPAEPEADAPAGPSSTKAK